MHIDLIILKCYSNIEGKIGAVCRYARKSFRLNSEPEKYYQEDFLL